MSKRYCQRCVYQHHPIMLMTYCLHSSTCQICQHISDCCLAISREDYPEMQHQVRAMKLSRELQVTESEAEDILQHQRISAFMR